MLAGGVVEHQVDAQAHVALVQRAGDLLEVVHRAQPRVHRAVVRHGVAAVVLPRPRLQQRHEVQVRRAELTEVVEPAGQLGEGAAEPVDVADVALHPGALEPAGVDLAPAVQPAQLVGRSAAAASAIRSARSKSSSASARPPYSCGERLVDVGQRHLDPGQEGVGLVGAERGDRVLGQPRPEGRPRPPAAARPSVSIGPGGSSAQYRAPVRPRQTRCRAGGRGRRSLERVIE